VLNRELNKISVADIDNLNLFKLSEHPQIGTHIQGMKSEINKYHALVKSINSLDEKRCKGERHIFVA
jgi:hypothetical protein